MQIGASTAATTAATAIASTPFDPIDEKFERLYRSSELENVFDAWEDGSGLLSKGRVVMIAQEAVRVSEMQSASIDQLLLKSHFKKEEFVALFMDGWDKWAMMLASQVFENSIEQMVSLAGQVQAEQNIRKAAAKPKKAAKTQENAAKGAAAAGLSAEQKTQSIGAATAEAVAKAQKAAAKEAAAKATAEEASKFQKEYEAVLEAAAKTAAEEAAKAQEKANAEEAVKAAKATAEEAAKFHKEAEAVLEAKAAAETAAKAQEKVAADKALAIAELQAELESEVKTAKASLLNDKAAIEGKEALAVEDARIVFAKTAPDFEGNITHSELKRALKASPKGLKERYGIRSWNTFFGELDTDGDGKISSKEFTDYCVAKALDL